MPLLLKSFGASFDQCNRVRMRPYRQQPRQHQFFQTCSVLIAVLRTYARTATAPQLMIKARRAVGSLLASALEPDRLKTELMFGSQPGDPAPRRCARSKRPITAAELRRVERIRPGHRHTPFIVEANQHLIQLAPRRHVMRRQSCLNQLRFAQQRAQFAGGFLPIEPVNFLRQPQLARCTMFGIEVTRHTRAQIDALADVNRMFV